MCFANNSISLYLDNSVFSLKNNKNIPPKTFQLNYLIVDSVIVSLVGGRSSLVNVNLNRVKKI
jgi:hypothetical protein